MLGCTRRAACARLTPLHNTEEAERQSSILQPSVLPTNRQAGPVHDLNPKH